MILMATKDSLRTSGNDKRLVVYVSQEIFDLLEKLATEQDRSISNYTRNLITKALENEVK